MAPPREVATVEHALSVLTQVGILFTLMVVGFVARRKGILEGTHLRGFTGLIIKVALPAMILSSMTTMPFSTRVLGESGLLLVISFAMYGIFALVSLPLGRLFSSVAADRGVYRFVLVFSNVGFMGFPLVERVFGSEALFYAAVFNLPFNLLTFTLGVSMLLHYRGPGQGPPWYREFLSPVVVSVIAGFALFLLQVPLPAFLTEALDLTGSLTTPLSMIAVGAMLAGTSIRRTLGQPALYTLSLLRLLVWPILVYGALRPWVGTWWLAAIPALISGMPAAANTAILAHEHGANESLASQAVFLTTLFSLGTIPVLAALLALWRF